jgi:endonuclease/exonuclease/phosphatase (EEP) superfamily protein YafD
MRVIAWNLNHRAAKRRIPEFVAEELALQQPDAVLLTEYVEGDDQARFFGQMSSFGFGYASLSIRVQRQNQTLIFSKKPILEGNRLETEIDPSISPNYLHVRVDDLNLIAYRIPAFTSDHQYLKRATWDLLRARLKMLSTGPTVIGGDFNTALEDTYARCGDCLRSLVDSGWVHAVPSTGYSWRAPNGRHERRIDHVFATPGFKVERAIYSWAFLSRLPTGKHGVVGYPDHAMLVVDLTQASAPSGKQITLQLLQPSQSVP